MPAVKRWSGPTRSDWTVREIYRLDELQAFREQRVELLEGIIIEKAQETYSRERADAIQKKLTGTTLTLEDFRDQLGQANRLGSMDQILEMLPGGQRLKEMAGGGVPERDIKRILAMIDSMTPRERRDHTIINGSRKKRIARGSGTTVQDLNRLIKQFLTARKMMKALTAGGGKRQLAQLLRG